MVDNNSQKNESSSVVVLYCRVCKRGFNSAGALGGHMRSHGAVGDNSNRNYGENISEQKYMMNNFRRDKSEGQKHSYNLRTNSNRLVLGNNRSTSDYDLVDVEKSEYYYYDHDVKEKQHCSREEEEDLANCLVMLSNKFYDLPDNNKKEDKNKAKEVEKGMFQCKACKKIFSSHQALGGHRASHKKVKGCYAAKLDDNINDDDNNNNNNNNDDDNDIDEDSMISPSDLILQQESNDFQSQSPTSFSRKRSRVHQCSICHRVFLSGQALGGHKRCHWLTSSLPETTFIPTFGEIQYHNQEQVPLFTNTHQPLDLNFPAQLGNPAEVGLKLHNNPFEHEGPRSHLQLWTDQQVDTNQNQNHKCKDSLSREENRKAKEAKLSNLKDVNLDGGSSWLQVGIGPTPDILATLQG
ncbi:zinc finger protein ZAT9-like [Solanum dulcamara]|uniref:zinc finger protein ZAT9-like n=1 Tax=Solanum dulcamara TaxID=45834 RepID=UPI002486B0DC|nr:zinc finger protein ZAT9-like [Solanum dulcamara]